MSHTIISEYQEEAHLYDRLSDGNPPVRPAGKEH